MNASVPEKAKRDWAYISEVHIQHDGRHRHGEHYSLHWRILKGPLEGPLQ